MNLRIMSAISVLTSSVCMWLSMYEPAAVLVLWAIYAELTQLVDKK